ncbi:hypothetical protein NJI34_00320 [Pseudomonas sp. S 311-6]|uniref:hypothetical protein n=1 Tax=Pseudomonas TaxID=286 RepID=UPI00209840C1|nr:MULTISPECIES: hypothetical protein [Pseudomonas]MCO7563571.1 hypothetical protein [Pseudomonas mosselii]MCO7616234.1 hypothetical protein [Pseudomonas guariconensis]MCO7635227.1 hypothetical protein [Pseudomonas sp. S 311-6]
MSRLAAELVPVLEEHIQALLTDMREADLVELRAIRGWAPEREVRHAVSTASHCAACVVDGKVVAIFGDSPHDAVYGLPWMASTTWINQYRRQFLAECRPVIEGMRSRHQVLLNLVDVRNTLAIRWLKWLGFQFLPAVPYGINGELFYPFQMEGTACAQ